MNIENTREILNQFDYRFDSFIKNAIAKKSFNEHLSEYAPQVDTNFGESLIFDSRCLHTGEPLIMHTRVSMDIRIISVADYDSENFLFQGQGKMQSIYQPGDAYSQLSSDQL